MIFSENGFRSIVPRTKELNSLKIYANFHQNWSRREGKTGVVSIISEQLSYTLNFTCLHINFTSQKWIIIDVELELVFLSNSPAPWQSIHHLPGLGLWWLSHSVSKVFHVDIQVSVISVVPPSTLCCIEYTFRWCPVIVLGNTFEKYIV